MSKEKSAVKGRSQKAIVKLLKDEGKSLSAQEIGDRLYATTSSCASIDGGCMGGKATPEERRKAWAQKVLVVLRRNGIIKQDPKDSKKFTLTAEGESAVL